MLGNNAESFYLASERSRLSLAVSLATLALAAGLTRPEVRDELFGGGTAGEILWGGRRSHC